MKSLFDMESGVWTIPEKIVDGMWLSILWLVCSIPIFTIGASSSAVYYVTLKMAKNEEGKITKQFFKAFKQNFKQGTIVWLIMLVVGSVLMFNLYLCSHFGGMIGQVMFVATLALLIWYMVTMEYLFPVLARFEVSLKNLFLLSFLYAAKNPLKTFFMTVLLFLAGVTIFYIPLFAIVAFGLLALANSYLLIHAFEKGQKAVTSEE